MKWLHRAAISLALLVCLAAAALAQNVSTTTGFSSRINVSGAITRPANSSQYTAQTAVCASTSVVCTPISLGVLRQTAASASLERVWLTKSGNTQTNASFTVYFFASSPTVGTTIKDNVAYTGPFAADFPNYLGQATCTSSYLSTDASAQTWFECAILSSQQAVGLPVRSTDNTANIYAMIETMLAYTPASAEVFTLYVSARQD